MTKTSVSSEFTTDIASTTVAHEPGGNSLFIPSIMDMLENNWTNPFSNQPMDLLNLSTGAAATPAVTKHLLSAHTKGEEASKIHMEKLESGSGFYDPIKKLKCKHLVSCRNALFAKLLRTENWS